MEEFVLTSILVVLALQKFAWGLYGLTTQLFVGFFLQICLRSDMHRITTFRSAESEFTFIMTWKTVCPFFRI